MLSCLALVVLPLAAPAQPRRQTPSVSALLRRLTTAEKAAQLIVPWMAGNYTPFDDPEFQRIVRLVDSLKVGGIVVSIGSPTEIAARINHLQRKARIPLLITSDLEGGTAFRVTGGTAFPTNMGVGAGGQEADAYLMGRIIAEEARAMGVHMTFSPVADVNNNPANPIINTRSFGGDPRLVARMVEAQIRGSQEHGLFATAKHFPGHGDTGTDTHLALPLIEADWNRIDTLELVPFRAAIRAGVTGIMSAHVSMPSLDSGRSRPATMVPEILTGILRDSLGFKGLIITDALDMGGIVNTYDAGSAAVTALQAGSDILLMPTDPVKAVEAIVAAVKEGRITRARLDSSVRRVLTLKSKLGLFRRRTVNLDSVGYVVSRQSSVDAAAGAARRSLVLLKDSTGVLDNVQNGPRRIAIVSFTETGMGDDFPTLASDLRTAGHQVSVLRLVPASGPASYDSARAAAAGADVTLFAVAVRAREGIGSISMPPELANLITGAGPSTLLVSFGSPYLISQAPSVPAYLLAWTITTHAERAVAEALQGAPVTGRLPVDIPPAYRIGDGIMAGGRPLTQPASGRDAERWLPMGRLLDSAMAAGAAPGGVVGVSVGGLRYFHGAGRLGIDDSTLPDPTTIYDLASLTKVIGLTTGMMLAVSEGRIELDAPVQRYLPQFTGRLKEQVTIRHLLTHSSGLPDHRRLWELTSDRTAAIALVDSTPLDTVPGARAVYSDLGAIVLTQVLESVYGMRIDSFLSRRVFPAMGLRSTRYLPPSEWLSRIAPTEQDPWRGRILRGEVHDENAARLEGVSGHAGLFGSAADLLYFGEQLLRAAGGDSTGLGLSPAVVREFIRRQEVVPGSSRALGWDTPSPNSSAGSRLSPNSFGHTGFTGTSIWMDPERKLVIVLLTNRVHPTRENNRHAPLRRAVADLAATLADPSSLVDM